MSPLGHLSIGFMAKSKATKVNVILLLTATFLIDIIYFILVGAGTSKEAIAWGHSLLAALVLTLLTFSVAWLICKNTRSALVLALCVFSHWILDFIVWDNLSLFVVTEHHVGLGFYTHLGIDSANPTFSKGAIITTILELSMLAFGIVVYCKNKKILKQA